MIYSDHNISKQKKEPSKIIIAVQIISTAIIILTQLAANLTKIHVVQ